MSLGDRSSWDVLAWYTEPKAERKEMSVCVCKKPLVPIRLRTDDSEEPMFLISFKAYIYILNPAEDQNTV